MFRKTESINELDIVLPGVLSSHLYAHKIWSHPPIFYQYHRESSWLSPQYNWYNQTRLLGLGTSQLVTNTSLNNKVRQIWEWLTNLVRDIAIQIYVNSSTLKTSELLISGERTSVIRPTKKVERRWRKLPFSACCFVNSFHTTFSRKNPSFFLQFVSLIKP